MPRQIGAHGQGTGAIPLRVPAPCLGMDFVHWGDLFVNQGLPLSAQIGASHAKEELPHVFGTGSSARYCSFIF